VPGIGLLHRVHGEDPDGVDADPGLGGGARGALDAGRGCFHRQGPLLEGVFQGYLLPAMEAGAAKIIAGESFRSSGCIRLWERNFRERQFLT
jgi:hypothetical protein